MAETETICSECGITPGKKTQYCPECGEGPDPWNERASHDFERDVELPLIFNSEVYDDGYGLWKDFCSAAFGVYSLSQKDVANFPNGMPKMKYQTFMVYYKLDEEHELHGPFLDKAEARNA